MKVCHFDVSFIVLAQCIRYLRVLTPISHLRVRRPVNGQDGIIVGMPFDGRTDVVEVVVATVRIHGYPRTSREGMRECDYTLAEAVATPADIGFRSSAKER